MVVYVDDFQFLEKREGEGKGPSAPRASAKAPEADANIEEAPF
jgi:hypothetical protein